MAARDLTNELGKNNEGKREEAASIAVEVCRLPACVVGHSPAYSLTIQSRNLHPNHHQTVPDRTTAEPST